MTEASPSRHQLYVTVTKLGLGIGWEESIPSGLISPPCAQNFWVGTCRIQRRVSRYAQTHALLDRVGEWDGDSFPSTSIPCRTPALPCRRLRTTQGDPPFHATALPYMQCMPCNARIACMACATRMPRKACATRCDRTILLCIKVAYLRKSSSSVR